MDTGQTARITNFEEAPEPSPVPPMEKCSPSRLSFRAKVRISPICPPRLLAQRADPPTVYDRLVYHQWQGY